jgi:hypothetical protein
MTSSRSSMLIQKRFPVKSLLDYIALKQVIRVYPVFTCQLSQILVRGESRHLLGVKEETKFW